MLDGGFVWWCGNSSMNWCCVLLCVIEEVGLVVLMVEYVVVLVMLDNG